MHGEATKRSSRVFCEIRKEDGMVYRLEKDPAFCATAEDEYISYARTLFHSAIRIQIELEEIESKKWVGL